MRKLFLLSFILLSFLLFTNNILAEEEKFIDFENEYLKISYPSTWKAETPSLSGYPEDEYMKLLNIVEINYWKNNIILSFDIHCYDISEAIDPINNLWSHLLDIKIMCDKWDSYSLLQEFKTYIDNFEAVGMVYEEKRVARYDKEDISYIIRTRVVTKKDNKLYYIYYVALKEYYYDYINTYLKIQDLIKLN